MNLYLRGVRVRVRKLPSSVEIRLIPRRLRSVRPLFWVAIWAAVSIATVVAIARKGAFILLPIIVIPAKRLYRPLCATLNRVTIAIDQGRVSVRQGPLPVHRPLTLATADVCEFRARELDEAVGGWFVSGQSFDWTLKIQTHAPASPTLDLALPARHVAEDAASALNEALSSFRLPKAYR